ncbi:hypothetical protein GCM10009712_01560 [Pseudarthrobacter sulfonivorans]
MLPWAGDPASANPPSPSPRVGASPMVTPARTATVPPTIQPFVSRSNNCHKLPKVMVLPYLDSI